MDRVLKLYVDAAYERFSLGKYLSIACDKSRVGNQALMNGFACDDGNVGAWAVPQVPRASVPLRLCGRAGFIPEVRVPADLPATVGRFSFGDKG